jgi:hypothetical protein
MGPVGQVGAQLLLRVEHDRGGGRARGAHGRSRDDHGGGPRGGCGPERLVHTGSGLFLLSGVLVEDEERIPPEARLPGILRISRIVRIDGLGVGSLPQLREVTAL